MKIFYGVIKKVLTEEQYELISTDIVKPDEIKFEDTVRVNEQNNEYLPIRVSFKDVDSNGNEKYVYDEDSDEYQKVYRISPLLYAYGKELRILLELGEFSPVKIVTEQIEIEEGRFVHKVICVQSQLCGKVQS